MLGGILIAIAIVYLRSLANSLVADSWVMLEPRSLGETLGFFARSVIPPEWQALWFRPLPMLTFWLDTLLWPGTSWGPHLVNLTLHLVNTALVWHLTATALTRTADGRQKTPSILPPAIAALFFGLHPLAVGSVGWAAARFDVISVTFGLAGLNRWLVMESGNGTRKTALAAVLLLAASVLSKEQGIVFAGVAILMGLAGSLREGPHRSRERVLTAALLITVGAILVYRTLLFHGLGGYLISRRVLAPQIPIAYLAAILFPFLDTLSHDTGSWVLLPAIAILIGISTLILRSPGAPVSLNRHYLIAFGLLTLAGLASTLPHGGLTFAGILHHSEARFALVPLAGAAVLIGCVSGFISGSPRGKRILVVILACWSIAAALGTDSRLIAWHDAGITAREIVDAAIETVPNPPRNARFLFFDIPRENDRNAYIFGIGLKEALMARYPGRADLDILVPATGADLKTARPDSDLVFGYDRRNYRLERLTPRTTAPSE